MGNTRFSAHKNIALSHDMCLMYVGSAHCGDDWVSVPHTHDCTEIFYCTRGVGEFTIGNEKQAVGSGDLIIINSNVEHTETSTMTNPLEFIAIGIYGGSFSFLDTNKNWLALNFAKNNEKIAPYFDGLLHELKYCSKGYEEVCAHLVELIFLKISRQISYNLAPSDVAGANKECASVKRYIDAHYREDLTLSQLSDIVHINKYYLSHSFNKAFGITPINYMINLRITESKHMLEKTNYSVSAISNTLGFSSASYFAQCFKKHVGQTPNEFRKNRNI